MVAYLVLKSFDPDDADDPFHEAFGGVIDRFAELHQTFIEPTGRTETDIQVVVPWADESGSIELAMYDNYLVMVRHLEIHGDHPRLPELVSELREALDVIVPTDHLEATLDQLGADPKLVFQVALSAPEVPDPAYVSFIARAIDHPQDDVRDIAAQAVSLLGWPELLDSLQNAYAAERPGRTKVTMSTALRAWERL
jgi:hypothetical protein